MRIVAVTIVGLLLATAYPAIAETINSPPVDLKPTLAPTKLPPTLAPTKLTPTLAPTKLTPTLAPTKLTPTKLALALAERATHRATPARSGQPTRDRIRHVSARDHVSAHDDGLKQRLNSGTIGLAAGQPEGAPLRFATELARVLDDGD